MHYYLGIDIGTTSTKAVAFNDEGDVIANYSFHYEMDHPQPGYSEQDPEVIFKAVVDGVHQVLSTLTPHQPLFISFSAAMHSFIAVSEEGALLTRCIIWADNRADAVAQQLRDGPYGNQFYKATGVPTHSMSPLCKLLWFREHQREIYNNAYKFIGIKEWVFYRLFGEFVIDTSIASATGFFNSKTLNWDQTILNYAGISASRLSTVVSTKKAFYNPKTSSDLSISSNIPFIIGSSDGALSNLGTGAVDSNIMAVTIGTSGAARMVITAPKTDKQMRTFCYHVKDHLYIAGGANNNGAVVLQWLKESLLQTDEDFDSLFEQAKHISAGSDGLLLLPYILGERAPIWNSNAKGVYFGLTIQHTKAHLIRASLEGVIFSLYSIIKVLSEQHVITEIRASGGFAKSDVWLQILADVTNIKILVSDSVESSALGAVMLGAEALGIEQKFRNNVLSAFEQDSGNHEIYKRQFARFERLYALLRSEMINENDQFL